MNYTRLSKTLSHALRHEPWLYELELDSEGWAEITAVLSALTSSDPEWSNVTGRDLERMIAASEKRRHEIDGSLIRALYGHSIPGKLRKVPADPPSILYHGTAPEIVSRIFAEGLKPMGRQYVHLSVDENTAAEVGRRKSATPVILTIKAAEASECGAAFYEGNEKVWLADEVAPDFIKPVP